MNRARTTMQGDRLARLGALSLLVVFGVSAAVFSGIPQRWLANRGTTIVTAQFPTTARLSEGSPVRIDGVEVGRVDNLELDSDARSTIATLRLRTDAFPLYRDARAAVRWRTVLGGNYYVALTPGVASSGPLSPRRIDLAHSDSQVELDEILTIFRPGARTGLRQMLRETPQALSDAAAPRDALRQLAADSGTLDRGIDPLRGQRKDADLRLLLKNTKRTVVALDSPQTPVRDVVEGAASTLQVTARRQADIRAAIARAASTLPGVSTTMRQLRGTVRLAAPVVVALQKPAGDVAPTLRSLRPTVEHADTLLDRARPLLRSLRPAANDLASAARQGLPLLKDIAPSLNRIGDHILPDLALRDPGTKRTTYEMLGPSIASLGAVAAPFDGTSHLVNLSAQVGQSNINSLPCKTYIGNPTAEQLVQCEALKHLLTTVFPKARTSK